MENSILAERRQSEPFLARAFELSGEVAVASGDYSAVAHYTLERALDLFGGEGACLEIAVGDEMVYEASLGIAAPFLGLRLPIGSSLSGRVMRLGIPDVCSDTETDERVNRDACRKIGLRSMLLLPLRYGVRQLGVLKVMSVRADGYSIDHLDVLSTLSMVLGAVIGRARTEEALRQSEDRYRATFQNVAVGIGETSIDGCILHVNQALCEFLGRRASEIVGKTFRDFTHPEDQTVDAMLLQEVLSGARDNYTREKRYLHHDGQVVWGSVTISSVRDEAGMPQRLIGVVQDVTSRKEAEADRDAAQAASTARAKFLANMSHEIRTPMNGVIGLASVLRHRPLDDSSRSLVDTIVSSGQTLLRIIDDILDLSKMEAGKLVIEQVPCEVASVVREVMDLYAATAQRRGVELRAWPPSSPMPLVLSDPVRLRQILSNLVSNALKFTSEGGVAVAWTWSPVQEQVQLCLEVRDTGIGIPAERVEKVFESYAQADTDTHRNFGGTGLGLTISRNLVELMTGRLSLKSEVGVGSTFLVELSLELADAHSLQGADQETRKTFARRILLAEDNEINVLVASEMLESFGCTVDVAGDGFEAVQLARSRRYDLIFMDVHMPRCSGLEATTKIREGENLAGRRRTPIVALTASAFQEERAACFESGMDDVLLKPITMESLQKVIEKV